jgi:TonB family protein
MNGSVSSLLESRLHAGTAGPSRRFVMIALGLHVGIALAGWLGPILLAEPPQPIEFVSVRIIPAARLGVDRPKPPPPKPEPPRPEPVVEAKPESSAPVLPAERPQPRRPEPEPAPVAESSAPAVDHASEDALPQGVAGGSAAGLALGAPSATLDNPEFTYGYYVDQMLNLISRNWSRPLVGGGVEARLHFDIARNGTIRNVRITHSSGINSFDLAALRAIQASTPLPPLPRAFRESSLGVTLIVR